MKAARLGPRLCRRISLCVMLWSLGVTMAAAHEIRPAYLQIDETGNGRFSILWRTPLLSGMRLPVVLRLPDDVRTVTAPSERTFPDSLVERRIIETPDGLGGKRIEFAGLQATITDVIVRAKTRDGAAVTTIVRPSQPWVDIEDELDPFEVAATFFRHGVDHILYGIDHLLFVASLMLVVRGWPMLFKTVTAFTLAHSITLALATFGLVTLPAQPVEAMVALSIVLVCVEAVRFRRGETSLASRWPWVVAFAFGLLHGFGFAGALIDLGLPKGDLPLALLFFNIGVEAGQLLFIAAILAVTASVSRIFVLPRRAPIAATYAIGCVAVFWVFERIDKMFF